MRFLFTKTLFLTDDEFLVGFPMSVSPPEMKISKHDEYRVVAATGVFGGLIPAEGQIIFYTERLEPKSDSAGKLSVGCIVREMQVEVHMSPTTFKSIAEWMSKHVKEFEEREKQQITPAKMDERPKQWV